MTDALAAATPRRWRLPAPAPDALVAWPPDWGRRFLVSVDVEEEFDWSRPLPPAVRGVAAVRALPDAHARFAARGVPLLHLVDHEVAVDAGAAALLRELAEEGAEIGAQLHPWVTPPHREVPDAVASFAGNLPPALEAEKLDRLVDAITRAAGVVPRAYRAGRYGLGPHTAALLASRGFRADLSVRARFQYREEGGPDFTALGPAAFRLAPGLVELPLSTVYTGRLRARGPALDALAAKLPRGRGALARLGFLSRVPLTPEGTSAREACAAIRAAAGDGERFLHLAFHSPSLVPGNTPYVRTARDLALFHAWWDEVLAALEEAGYRPASLAQALAAAG